MARYGRRSALRHIVGACSVESALVEPTGDRVAVIASYGATPRVSRSVTELIARLTARDYSVILVRAADDDAVLEWPEGRPEHCAILRKPNIGYDFGSWAAAMEWFPRIRAARHVLLVNDSILGPFGPIDAILDDFEASTSDAWSATSSLQVSPHLQSFFIGFNSGALDTPVLREFWTALPLETEKQAFIDKFEFGLSRALFSESYSSETMFPSQIVVPDGDNPAIKGWRRLLELGFPFVKRELLTNPDVTPDGHDVPTIVQQRFHHDPAEWI